MMVRKALLKSRKILVPTIAQEVETCVYPNLIQCAVERGVVDWVVNEKRTVYHHSGADRKYCSCRGVRLELSV